MAGKLIRFRCLRKCAPWPYYPGELFGVTDEEAKTLPLAFFERIDDAAPAASASPAAVPPSMPQPQQGRGRR